MKKSVYSIVLTDGVVEAADRLAYAKGVSRSALMDELLARALSCMTPEMRMRDIFLSMENLMEDNEIFRLQTRASDSMLSLFSAIKYKYKPTIRYSVELYRQRQDHVFGELKIQSRTQSEQLARELEQFYKLWARVEHESAGGRQVRYILSDGKLTRSLSLSPSQKNCTETELGTAIAQYIQAFDRGLKLYFDHVNEPRLQQEKIRQVYAAYINQNPVLV